MSEERIHSERVAERLPKKRGLKLLLLICLSMTLLIAAILAGFLVFFSKADVPGETINVPYISEVPGAGCPKSDPRWSNNSGHYDTNKEHDVDDNSTQTSCQSNGLLVTRSKQYEILGTVFYNDQRKVLPSHYKTQVTGTIMAGDKDAVVALSVQLQDHYGAESFQLDNRGQWYVIRYSDETGTIAATLATGFLPQPKKKFTLMGEVDGPVMNFSIDGSHVVTVVDGTYTVGHAISFGIADNGAQQPPSALFSHFVFTSLANGKVSREKALATATAQTQQHWQQTYRAATPGPCGNDPNGEWQTSLSVDDQNASLTCLPNGLRITQNKGNNSLSREGFYWLNGNFPPSYRVEAQIDVSALNGGCAGIMTRIKDIQGYNFHICQSGNWNIVLYDKKGEGHILAEGAVASAASYQVSATLDGRTQTFSINGQKVGSTSDTTLINTDRIDLTVDAAQNATGAATFSNFVLTPLP